MTHARPTELVPRRTYHPSDPDLPPSVLSVCSGGVDDTTVLNSTAFNIHGVTITTGRCGNGITSYSGVGPMPTGDADRPVVRPVCPTAPNNCISRFGTQFQGNGWVSKCGARCDSTCYPGSGGPNPYDCQYIFNNLWAENPRMWLLPLKRVYVYLP
ncbi:hypothetical protein FRC18_007572 [Serendipita sp. 400]|nr:hypothetical protein FRC18_007572 [Serendipita sp. 400]